MKTEKADQDPAEKAFPSKYRILFAILFVYCTVGMR